MFSMIMITMKKFCHLSAPFSENSATQLRKFLSICWHARRHILSYGRILVINLQFKIIWKHRNWKSKKWHITLLFTFFPVMMWILEILSLETQLRHASPFISYLLVLFGGNPPGGVQVPGEGQKIGKKGFSRLRRHREKFWALCWNFLEIC